MDDAANVEAGLRGADERSQPRVNVGGRDVGGKATLMRGAEGAEPHAKVFDVASALALGLAALHEFLTRPLHGHGTLPDESMLR